MISNLDRISSDSISRTVNYVLKDSAQVVATNMPAGLLKKCRNLTTSFRSIASLNKRVKKPLYHISIRCAPEDGSLSPLEWSKISGRFLELMELEENPFTAATHGDNHVHLLISRVDDSGKCYDASWDCFKAQKALRTIESEGGYRRVKSSFEVRKSRDTKGQVHRIKKEQEEYKNGLRDEPPEPSKKTQLQQAIDKGIEQASSVEGIKEFLSSQNIQTRQKNQGWSVELDEYHFAGNQLGRDYTLNSVRDALESQVNREQETPEPEITKEAEPELTPQVSTDTEISNRQNLEQEPEQSVVSEAQTDREQIDSHSRVIELITRNEELRLAKEAKQAKKAEEAKKAKANQQSLVERIAPIVSSWINLLGEGSFEGKKHSASWNCETNCLTLRDKTLDESDNPVMLASWDEEKQLWKDTASKLTEEKVRYWEKEVEPRVLAQQRKQRTQTQANSREMSL